MKKLSPAEVTDLTGKPYIYCLVTMRINEKYSLASILTKLRSKGVEVVYWNEGLRSILVRVDSKSLPYILEVANNYADSVTYELKASLKTKIPQKLLKSTSNFIVNHSSRRPLLVGFKCSHGALLIEASSRIIRCKYCRSIITPPSHTPPSLCIFYDKGTDILKLLDEFKACIHELLEFIHKYRDEKQ